MGKKDLEEATTGEVAHHSPQKQRLLAHVFSLFLDNVQLATRFFGVAALQLYLTCGCSDGHTHTTLSQHKPNTHNTFTTQTRHTDTSKQHIKHTQNTKLTVFRGP